MSATRTGLPDHSSAPGSCCPRAVVPLDRVIVWVKVRVRIRVNVMLNVWAASGNLG